MLAAVDKADSAQFTREEILHPTGWALLAFIMDARTGLGRYKDYRVSNYQLMHDLIDACTRMSIDEILLLPDVQERVQRYFEQDVLFRDMLARHTWTEENIIITDLRDLDPIHCGNRFLIYALHPEQNVSIWIVNGFQNQNCVFACGRSICGRTAAAATWPPAPARFRTRRLRRRCTRCSPGCARSRWRTRPDAPATMRSAAAP
jgi:hypothetical protein